MYIVKLKILQEIILRGQDLERCQARRSVRRAADVEERQKVLGEIFEKVRSKDSPIKLSKTIDATPTELVRVAKQLGFEGILAKRRDSYYEPGKRSGAWLKYRINRGQELVIGGEDVPGNPIDSIINGYYQNGTLLMRADRRDDFVPHTRRAVASQAQRPRVATCPFANLPERKRKQRALTKEEMKNCKWVRPEVVAQIEFCSADTGCASTAIRFRRLARRQRPTSGCTGGRALNVARNQPLSF